MQKYNDAKFRVQSVLLPDFNNANVGEGEIYVTSWNIGHPFIVRDFSPHLMHVEYASGRVAISDTREYDPRLDKIMPKVTLDMYQELTAGRGGRILRRSAIGEKPFRAWSEWMLKNARARDRYLALDRVIMVNPSEWGQVPYQESTEPITAGYHPGRNVTGHKLPR